MTVKEDFLRAREGDKGPTERLDHFSIFAAILGSSADNTAILRYLFPFHANFIDEFRFSSAENIPENKSFEPNQPPA